MRQPAFRFACCWVLLSARAVSAAEFEARTWPGEGVPVLVATGDELTVYEQPDAGSAKKAVRYGIGWRVPFAESLYRTVTSSVIEVRQAGVVEVWCGEARSRKFEPGEKLEYLQYRAEGWITARVDGDVCEVPLYLEEDVFGTDVEEPETEWWVRVSYRDGSSPGWLLVTDGQVSFDRREF